MRAADSPSATGTDSLKQRLIDAGVELLDSEGPDGVGLRSIARRAGVSHGAPRRHFPTHRSLLAAIARAGIEDLLTTVAPVLADDNRAARDRLIEVAHAYVTFARERRAMFDLITRHDLLDAAGGNLRELSVPLLGELARLVGADEDTADDQSVESDSGWLRALGLWTAIHGIAVLGANRTLEVAPVLQSDTEVIGALIRHAVDHHVGRTDN